MRKNNYPSIHFAAQNTRGERGRVEVSSLKKVWDLMYTWNSMRSMKLAQGISVCNLVINRYLIKFLMFFYSLLKVEKITIRISRQIDMDRVENIHLRLVLSDSVGLENTGLPCVPSDFVGLENTCLPFVPGDFVGLENIHLPFVPSDSVGIVSRDEACSRFFTRFSKIIMACFLTVHVIYGANSLAPVLQPYKTALSHLVAAHQQLYAKKPILLTPGSLILATYQKLITPYAFNIAGYCNVVASEVARNYPFYQDVATLTQQYNSNAHQVGAVIALLPKSVQSEALEIFYAMLAPSVVQTCYNIVEQSAYAQNLTDQLLASVFQAYQLAWATQTKDMKLLGAATVAEFQSNMTDSMQTLFNAAIAHVQTQLSAGMNSGETLEGLYKKLEQYYQVLLVVCQNSGDADGATVQQGLIAAVQQQQTAYQQAQEQQAQAVKSADAARGGIVLDVNTGASVTQKIATSSQNFANAVSSYQYAADLYAQAQDLVGQNICSQQITLINDVELLVRMVQQLWALYLVDQSSSNDLESWPALQSFVVGSGSVDNAVASLQNMIGLFDANSEYPNSIGALQSTSQNLVIAGVLADAINSVKTVLLTQSMSAQTTTSGVNLKFLKYLGQLQDAQTGLTILSDFSNQLLAVVSAYQAGTLVPVNIAKLMGYAKQLDQFFLAHKHLNQYIPNFAKGLAGQKTWVDFVQQFLLHLGVDQQTIQQAGTTTVVTSVEPSDQDLSSLQATAQGFATQAQALLVAANFASASATYQKAMQAYQAVAQAASDGMTQIAMLSKAEQMYSLFVACSFASVPKKIANSYVATQYQLSFDPSLVGGTLPTFLNSAPAGQAVTTFTKAEQQDVFALVKAYLTAQLLSDKGYSFTDYFSDYQMTSMLTPSHTVQSYVDQISNYLNNFENIGLSSVTVDSATALTILLTDFPLALITPICSTLSSAAIYYASAALLFDSGTNFITLGGQSYHPGDQPDSAKLMMENLGSVYALAAQRPVAQVDELIKQITKQLGISAKGATVQTLPQNFSQTLRLIKQGCIQAQALLYQPTTSSAYSYFVQAGATDLATKIKQQFLNLYQTQINFMQSCLIGDPTSNQYETLVSSINQLYLNLASELDPAADATQIVSINANIADLYEQAGDQCLKFSYVDPALSGISQIHFMVAAQYFRSAQLQYQTLKNSVKVSALGIKINQMYYQACQQNLNIYLQVAKNGISYSSVTNPGQRVHVSLSQMVQDMADGSFVDTGELQAFKIVQNLLLDCAMVFEHLSATTAAPAKNHPNQQKVIKFLQKQQVVDRSVSSIALIDFMKEGIAEKLVQAMAPALKKFVADQPLFAAWNNILFLLTKSLYAQGFLGATSTQTAALSATQTEAFLTAVQKEGSSLQNPSAAYIA